MAIELRDNPEQERVEQVYRAFLDNPSKSASKLFQDIFAERGERIKRNGEYLRGLVNLHRDSEASERNQKLKILYQDRIDLDYMEAEINSINRQKGLS